MIIVSEGSCSTVGDLIDALSRLDRNLPLGSKRNEVMFSPRNSMHDIKKAVADQFGITVDALHGKSRRQEVVRARHIAMQECRKAGYGPSEIGRVFNRSHSTVIQCTAGK